MQYSAITLLTGTLIPESWHTVACLSLELKSRLEGEAYGLSIGGFCVCVLFFHSCFSHIIVKIVNAKIWDE